MTNNLIKTAFATALAVALFPATDANAQNKTPEEKLKEYGMEFSSLNHSHLLGAWKDEKTGELNVTVLSDLQREENGGQHAFKTETILTFQDKNHDKKYTPDEMTKYKAFRAVTDASAYTEIETHEHLEADVVERGTQDGDKEVITRECDVYPENKRYICDPINKEKGYLKNLTLSLGLHAK